MTINSSRGYRWRDGWQLWEDQHPLARNSVLLTLVALGLAGALRVVIAIAPQTVDWRTLFKIAILERVWVLINIVLLVVVGSSIIRLMWLALRRKVAYLSVVVVCVMPFILWVPLRAMPTFFEAAVSYRMERSYDDVFDAFKTLCDGWRARYGAQENIVFFPQNEPLGLLGAKERVTVWRESNTVFFDFGDETQPFGLACAIGDGKPAREGWRSQDFDYQQIDGAYYEFYGRSS